MLTYSQAANKPLRVSYSRFVFQNVKTQGILLVITEAHQKFAAAQTSSGFPQGCVT